MQKRYVLVALIVLAASLIGLASPNSVTFAAQINQVRTSTVTIGSSVSTSLLQAQLLINRAFKVISTTGTNLPCELWNFTFTGDQGQYVSGNFTSDISVDIYVVQDTSYQNWLKQGSCGSMTDAIAGERLTMAYSFNAAIPNSGKWDIVVVNSSNTRDADVSLAAYLSAGSSSMTEPMLTTFTTTGTSSGTFTSAPLAGVPGFPLESIALGLFIGFVALVILRSRRRS